MEMILSLLSFWAAAYVDHMWAQPEQYENP